MMPITYYKRLKWCSLILLPALAALMTGIGEVYQWQGSQQWSATCNLIAVFIGTLVQHTSKKYHLNQQTQSKEGITHERTENN